MRKILLAIMCVFCVATAEAQISKQNELFKTVPVINNKVAFLKEVHIQNSATQDSYEILKGWARKNYGKDPFISSVRYDARNNEIIAKSRVELVLPENTQGVREKMVMRFRIDGFIFKDKCVLEISDLSYLYDNAKEKKLPRVIRAEDFITDEMIDQEDALNELRINAKKSTLFFLNTLAKDFEEAFGY